MHQQQQVVVEEEEYSDCSGPVTDHPRSMTDTKQLTTRMARLQPATAEVPAAATGRPPAAAVDVPRKTHASLLKDKVEKGFR